MADGWVLVTGGSRGLGLGLAHKLVKSGRQVLLASRTHSKAAEAARIVGAEAQRPHANLVHGQVRPLELDVADADSVAAAVDTVQREYDQGVTCLVNNAGVYQHPWNEATWNLAMATNFLGAAALVEQLCPHFAEGARVVNVSSGLGELHFLSEHYGRQIMRSRSLDDLRSIGFDASDQQQSGKSPVPTYSVTKGMLNRATQLLAHDEVLRKRGVTVSAVTPGWYKDVSKTTSSVTFSWCRTDMGGNGATRSAEQGVDSIFWNITYEPSCEINAGFFIDGRPNPW